MSQQRQAPRQQPQQPQQQNSSRAERPRELQGAVFIEDSQEVRSTYLNSTITDTLAPYVYTINFDFSDKSFTFKKKVAKFNLPKHVFGRSDRYYKRIMERYDQKGKSVGMLAIGLKGSGKSLLSETCGNHMIETCKLPVLMVEQEIPLESLREILKDVGPCMLYFDEFGKVYGYHSRAELLPLFSDTDIKGVLFCITANDDNEVNEFLLDRPGRFLFRVRYNGVDSEGLQEIFRELNLSDVLKEHLSQYVKIHVNVSYDVLLKLIDEVKHATSEQEIRELMEVLNVPRLPVMGYKVVKITNSKGQQLEVAYQQYDADNRMMRVHFFDQNRRFQLTIDVDKDAKESTEDRALYEKDGYLLDTAKKRVLPSKESISEEGEEDPSRSMMRRLGLY